MIPPAPLRRVLVTAAILVASLPFLLGPAGAAKPKPKLRSRPCYDCHQESKQEYASKKFVHAPVAKTDCAACHESHGFLQKLVLSKPPPELCFSCHEALKTAAKPEHAHAAFEKGECLGCHDPHAANQPHLIRDGGPEKTAPIHAWHGRRV